MKARKKWRQYADNNVEREIVEFLREKKFDVFAVAENPPLRHQNDGFHYQKARQLDHYLLTHDEDFWDDKRLSLPQSPGVIIIPENQQGMAKYFAPLLRKIIERDYNIDNGPRYLVGVKFRLTWGGTSYKFMDGGKVVADTISWVDLGYKRK